MRTLPQFYLGRSLLPLVELVLDALLALLRVVEALLELLARLQALFGCLQHDVELLLELALLLLELGKTRLVGLDLRLSFEPESCSD